MRKIVSLMSILFVSSLFASTANILRKVDRTMNAPKDRVVKMDMILIDKDGKQEKREMISYQKGTNKKLVKFLAPSSVKGVSFLSLSDTQMYLYMPAFRRIRRIASHVKNDTFMGTDLSYDDMSSSEYEKDYNVKSQKVEKKEAYLKLIPKDSDSAYSYLEMIVDVNYYIPKEIKFYNKSKKLWKVLTMSDIKVIKGYVTPQSLTMKDILSKHQTIMKIREVQYDTNLNKKIFSKRFMKR